MRLSQDLGQDLGQIWAKAAIRLSHEIESRLEPNLGQSRHEIEPRD